MDPDHESGPWIRIAGGRPGNAPGTPGEEVPATVRAGDRAGAGPVAAGEHCGGEQGWPFPAQAPDRPVETASTGLERTRRTAGPVRFRRRFGNPEERLTIGAGIGTVRYML